MYNLFVLWATRWAISLQDNDNKVVYREGKEHNNVDALL